jgi:hypothetical protein
LAFFLLFLFLSFDILQHFEVIRKSSIVQTELKMDAWKAHFFKTSFVAYNMAKWILIGTDSHLTFPKLPLQCKEHSGNAFLN